MEKEVTGVNYQIGNNNQNGYDNTLFGGAASANKDGKNSILGNSQVGDLIACKLVKAGKEPVLEMNGIQMKTKASKELSQAKEGDTIFLKIQQANKNQVSLKIVGTQPQALPVESMLDSVTSAQVMQSTEQFSEMIKENLGGAMDEKTARENQKEILRSLSSEEIAKLRMMQIDVTNATLSDLMGMTITIRSGEHQDEVNERIADVVKDTIGKVRESILGGSASETSSTEQLTYVGTARLNSEGYIENHLSENTVVGATKENVNHLSRHFAQNKQQDASDNPDKRNAGYSKDELQGTIKNKHAEIVTEEQIVYMVKNHLDLTIGNLELAKNSVNEESPSQVLPINEKVWEDIFPQVRGIIEAAGMSVSEQSTSAARFMLQRELPITVDSLRLYVAANSLNQRGIKEEQLATNIEEQIQMGNAPEEARLGGRTIHERATQLMEKVGRITPHIIDQAVLQGKPLSISYLYNTTMRNIDMRRMRGPIDTGVEGASLSLSGVAQDKMQAESQNLSTNPNAIVARRQLEEIRLSMTMEAATRLIKQDINIDAKPLSQIVDSLRQQENNFYENMVSSQDLHDIPDDVDLLTETLKKTDGLKRLPEYALGEMVKRPTITVGSLYETASNMKMTLAGNAYETMMTKPRSDMGDSIQEAFQNIDAILEDMNLDRNEENRRAIRILSYNEMELNMNHVVSVKAADAKVQQMFETLTPQVVLNLIREKKNPLNMTIDGLNEEIMQQKEILGVTDEQRFSEFLYQMDKNSAITEDERKSFIGIYRLLDKIQKSHGKDIGAVVRNGQEVTLANLFAADKSRKAQGMNVAVDEKFGERVDISTSEKSILEQINTAYNHTLTGSIMRHIRPETFKSLQSVDYMNMSFEELNTYMKEGDNGLGESELIEELSNELQEALTYEDEVSTMLEAHDMPKTATNMIAAYQVMYGEDGIYGMIRKLKQSLPKEQRENITKREQSILDNLESKEDVVYGLESIRAGLSEAIHQVEQDGMITSKDIQSLKFLNAGMPIAMRAVQEEVFRIPLVVGEQVTLMKVSILRNGDHAGEITASMNTPQYGQLELYAQVQGNQIEGYIVTEEESGQKILEDNELTIRASLAKAGMETRDLRLDGTKPVLYGTPQEEEIPTEKLYRVAKQLLTAIKLTNIVADN